MNDGLKIFIIVGCTVLFVLGSTIIFFKTVPSLDTDPFYKLGLVFGFVLLVFLAPALFIARWADKEDEKELPIKDGSENK